MRVRISRTAEVLPKVTTTMMLAVAVATVVGCSGNRPAWERPAWERPASTSAPASSTSASTPTPGATIPGTRGSQASRAPIGSVERVVLPPPTAAKPAATAQPGAPDKPAAKPAAAAAPAPAPAPAPPVAAVVPTGAPGKAVAVATPVPPAPPKFMADPLWIGFDTHVARHEDTLLDLAVAERTGFIELAMANPGVDAWLPGAGTTIVVPTLHLQPDAPQKGIVINLPEQRLYYYENGSLYKSYPIGIGRDGHATPTGGTSIVRKQANPTWYPVPTARAEDPTLPAAMPPGPDNPLGTRALYLGWATYLIHGTNKEYGIGRRASRGCIRMYTADVETVFDRAAVGTPVTVVDQPVKVGSLNGELYIEASPTMAQVQQWEETGRFDRTDPEAARALVARKAGDAAPRIDWAVVDRALAERRGIVTRITQPAQAVAVASATPAPTAAATTGAAASVPPAAVIPRSPQGVAGTTSAAAVIGTRPPANPAAPPAGLVTPPVVAKAAAAKPATAAAGEPTGDELVKWLRGRLSATDAGR